MHGDKRVQSYWQPVGLEQLGIEDVFVGGCGRRRVTLMVGHDKLVQSYWLRVQDAFRMCVGKIEGEEGRRKCVGSSHRVG